MGQLRQDQADGEAGRPLLSPQTLKGEQRERWHDAAALLWYF